ncbi:hypothetical protein [Methylosinus sp. C49]|uniref:hypothetical protein n=1 Tax=Methylosinus sp. C49 TaxID=2699395 RepID=UPI0013793EA0|nr:hypothetical protein [Methylosinus sp. C49]
MSAVFIMGTSSHTATRIASLGLFRRAFDSYPRAAYVQSVTIPSQTIIPPTKRTALDRLGRPAEWALSAAQCDAVVCRRGVVRLLNGVQGRETGFGCAHIESNEGRMKQIRGMGFASLHAYLRRVFADVAFIGKQPDGRIILIAEFELIYHHIVCQWDDDLSIWSITTAIPKRNMRDVNPLWRRDGVTGANPVP